MFVQTYKHVRLYIEIFQNIDFDLYSSCNQERICWTVTAAVVEVAAVEAVEVATEEVIVVVVAVEAVVE